MSRFLSDGKSLVMVLLKDGNLEIYIMNLMIGKVKWIINYYVIDIELVWFLDGESLIYIFEWGGLL